MKKGRGFLTIGLFALGATLLSFSVVGSSRAALSFYSEAYTAEVRMQDIGVTLVENGDSVSSRDYAGADDEWIGGNGALVTKMLGADETGREDLVLGKAYPEELRVENSGTIDEYVRVTVYQYWMKNGVKQTRLDPGLIDLNFINYDHGEGDAPWFMDRDSSIESGSTKERTVLYYKNILPSGALSEPFTDTLTIDEAPIEAKVDVTEEEVVLEDGTPATRITTTYTYDGMEFCIQADVDAVQTHNAPAAIQSAWGVEMGDMGMVQSED